MSKNVELLLLETVENLGLVGDVVKVKVIDVDQASGKIRLSRKAAMKDDKPQPVGA